MLRVVIAICLGLPFFGQTQTTFHKVYDNGIGGEDGMRSIIEVENHNFVTCGSSSGNPESFLFVIKTNVLGDTIWQRSWNFISGAGEPGNAIIKSYNGGYVICGGVKNDSEGAPDSYLYKISSEGDSLWFQSYNAGFNDRARELLQTPDSGFILAGFRNVNEDSSLFVIKTDKLGNQEWIQYYGGTGWDKPYDIQLTPDGGFVMSGETGTISPEDIFLLKADAFGNTEWYQLYNSSTGAVDGAGHVVLAYDGGYIVSGTKETFAGSNLLEGWLFKVDNLGAMVWENNWKLPYDGSHFMFDMDRTLDGNYYGTAGGTNSTGAVTGPEPTLFKFTPNGDTLWTKRYSYLGGIHHTYTNDMHTTKDGGAILAGYIINLNVSGDNDAWLLKVDSLGKVCTVTDSLQGCSALDCNFITAHFTIPDTLNTGDTLNLQGNEFANNWQWDWSIGTSTLQNPTAVFTQTGSYNINLSVTYDGFCGNSVSQTIFVSDIPNGIQNSTRNIQNFKVYPNPSNGRFTIALTTPDKGAKIQVFNSLGQVVYQTTTTNYKTIIDLSNQPKGIYLVKIETEGQVATKRILSF